MRGRTLKEHIQEKMQDPEFKKAWDELDPEFELLESLIKAREKAGITQEELAKRIGTKQAYKDFMIHRNLFLSLQRNNRNIQSSVLNKRNLLINFPPFRILTRLLQAMDMINS